MYPQMLSLLAEDVLTACHAKGLTLGLAESCTGGLIGGLLTSVPGSSAVFDRGFITYSNQAKGQMLGIPDVLFQDHGAVSEACARAMAEGVLAHAPVNIAASVTGIAGPDGGRAAKPIGLVHIAVARDGVETLHQRHLFKGGRQEVRMQAVESVLRLLLQMVDQS